MPVDVSRPLGAFASGLTLDAVPTAIRDGVELTLLDTLGAIVGASTLPEAAPLAAFIAGAGPAEATALGVAERVSARQAAFNNAWLADLLDIEDTFKLGGSHPAATVIPAALAMAERMAARGSDVLAAIVAGYEVANRLAWAIGPEQEMRGFLSTGTAGAIGAAAAAARVLGLDAGALAHALNIAGFLCPISAADTLWEGESAKPAHAAQAAAIGVDAALLAAQGFTGAPLEGGATRRHGLLSMVTSAFDTGRALDGLGKDFTLGLCSFKLYPCCGYAHGALDAAIALHGRLEAPAAAIDAVTVRSYHYVVKAIGGRYTDPASSLTRCQFSLPYLVAVALTDGAVGLAQLGAERRADPAVHALAARVRVAEDPEMSAQYPARFPYAVEVQARGRTLVESVEAPRGTPQRPLERADILAKFDRLVQPVFGADGARRLASAVAAIRTADRFRWPIA